jgi:hypothetical protein
MTTLSKCAGSKRLAICEAVFAGDLTIDEARRRRAKILQRSRRGRILLQIERAERAIGDAPRWTPL